MVGGLASRPQLGGGLKTPLGGVPPPLVFDFRSFLAWTEVLRDCMVKLGVLVKSWVRRGVQSGSGRSWASPGRVLGASWAAPGHRGLLLGSSWAAPGRSWDVLGTLGRLLGYLGRLLGALGRLLERSWTPSWSHDGAQEAQSRPQDPPKSRPRRSKMALICKTIFRSRC